MAGRFSFSGEDFRVRDIHGDEVRTRQPITPAPHASPTRPAPATPTPTPRDGPSGAVVLFRSQMPSPRNPKPERLFSFRSQVLRVEGSNLNLGGVVIDKLGMKDGARDGRASERTGRLEPQCGHSKMPNTTAGYNHGIILHGIV